MFGWDQPHPITDDYLHAQFDSHGEGEKYRYSEACGILWERARVCKLIEQLLASMQAVASPTGHVGNLLDAVVAGAESMEM